jgi:hypothetical protein
MSADDAMALRWKKESAFTDWVIAQFRMGGWLVTHMKDSRKQHPNTHTGTPDIKAVHPVWAIIVEAELKMPGKYPKPDQREWLEALEGVAAITPNVEVYRWWPKHWREIQAVASGQTRIA